MQVSQMGKSIVEKTEGAVNNGQLRETGNTGYTIHRVKTNTLKNTKTKHRQN